MNATSQTTRNLRFSRQGGAQRHDRRTLNQTAVGGIAFTIRIGSNGIRSARIALQTVHRRNRDDSQTDQDNGTFIQNFHFASE